MKITDVTLTLFTWDNIPLTHYGVSSRSEAGGNKQLGLLRIATDEGVEGHAFLGHSAVGGDADGPALIEFLKPRIMGENPLFREKIFLALERFSIATGYRAVGAVDVALWDIAGKVAGLPLYQLMGAARESLPAYASSAVLGSIEAYAEEALGYKARNWQAYKIHPWGDPDRDIKLCTAVRKAVGDDYRLMLDSTWHYSFPEALRVGRALEELGYYWFEDPLRRDDVYGYKKLRQLLKIPLMATEQSSGGYQSYMPWLVEGATDYLRGDMAFKGGITAMLKSAHLADSFCMNYEVHHGGNSLNNVGNLHVSCAIANCEYFEVLLPAAAQKYGLVQDIEVDGEGLVHVPKTPGLGVDIDFDLIERKKVAVLS
jgi:L-alanine-DL-glutamate epimerase-like enolase superfamily enzyme